MTDKARHQDQSDLFVALLEHYFGAVSVSGARAYFRCPFCKSSSGRWDNKTMVVSAQSRIGRVLCFRCGYGGEGGAGRKNLLDVLVTCAGLTWAEAHAALRARLPRAARPERQAPRAYTLDRWAETFPALGPEHLAYLHGRGFSEETAERYHLRAGTGGYGGRVLIPTLAAGEVVFFQARALNGREPKYLNPASPPWRGKAEVVFNLETAAALGVPVVICEGPISAMTVGPDAVALSGKCIGEMQLLKLIEYGVRRAILMLDPDVTAAETRRAVRVLRPHVALAVVKLARWDPNELGQRACRERVDTACAELGEEQGSS